MKKYTVKDILMSVMFFAGFFTGIAFINLWGDTYLKGSSLLNQESLQLISQTQIDMRSLFFYLLAARGRCFLLLWLLGYTVTGIPVMLLFIGWLGVLAGVFASLFVIRMRMMGILFFLAALLPQALCYVPLIWIMMGAIYEKGKYRFHKKTFLLEAFDERPYVRKLFICLALLIVGVMLESCANPWLLRKATEYFFQY